MKKLFQKNIENFICDKCDFSVKGNGYTNHCPKCLWSKHVDVNPGDRLEKCGGMMEPIFVEKGSGGYHINHKCVLCGKKQPNRVSKMDDFEALVFVFREIFVNIIDDFRLKLLEWVCTPKFVRKIERD